LADDLFYIVTGTGFRTHDAAWIRSHIPQDCKAHLTDVTEEWGTLSLMGPKAREILSAVTDADVSNSRPSPFGHVREIAIAGHRVRALRVTYVGELGWELHMPIAGAGEVFDALMAAGEPLGLETGRLPGHRKPQAGEGVSCLGRRHHTERLAIRGRAGLGSEAQAQHGFHGPGRR
jgi:sarcosine dehydrogenase